MYSSSGRWSDRSWSHVLSVVCPTELAIGFEPTGPFYGELVLKLTFAPGQRLVGSLREAQIPLAERGTEVSVPDTGRRPAAEVVVVGAVLSDPTGPVRLRVGEREWHEPSWRALGPNPTSDGGWVRSSQRVPDLELPAPIEVESASVSFAIFLPGPNPLITLPSGPSSPSRPIVARMEFLAIDPLRRLAMITYRAELPTSASRVVVHPHVGTPPPISREGWGREQAVPILGNPVWRSSQAPPPSRSESASGVTVAIPALRASTNSPPDLGNSTVQLDMEALRRSPGGRVDSPLPFVRAPSSPMEDPTTCEMVALDGATLPFGAPDTVRQSEVDEPSPDTLAPQTAPAPSQAAPHAPFDAHTTKPALRGAERDPRSALPFPDSAPSRDPSPLRSTFAELRMSASGGMGQLPSSPPPRPPASGATPWAFAELRQAAGASPPHVQSTPPPEPAGPAAAPAWAAPAWAAPPPASPLPSPSPAHAPLPPDALTIEGFSIERYSALRAELLSAPESRRRILRAHGLSEVKWRLVERRWASHLLRLEARPAELVELATELQRSGRKRRSAAAHRRA
jgi:hypothetical protein